LWLLKAFYETNSHFLGRKSANLLVRGIRAANVKGLQRFGRFPLWNHNQRKHGKLLPGCVSDRLKKDYALCVRAMARPEEAEPLEARARAIRAKHT
jgi:hypothetical protein